MLYVAGGTASVAAVGGVIYYFMSTPPIPSIPTKGGYFDIGE